MQRWMPMRNEMMEPISCSFRGRGNSRYNNFRGRGGSGGWRGNSPPRRGNSRGWGGNSPPGRGDSRGWIGNNPCGRGDSRGWRGNNTCDRGNTRGWGGNGPREGGNYTGCRDNGPFRGGWQRNVPSGRRNVGSYRENSPRSNGNAPNGRGFRGNAPNRWGNRGNATCGRGNPRGNDFRGGFYGYNGYRNCPSSGYNNYPCDNFDIKSCNEYSGPSYSYSHRPYRSYNGIRNNDGPCHGYIAGPYRNFDDDYNNGPCLGYDSDDDCNDGSYFGYNGGPFHDNDSNYDYYSDDSSDYSSGHSSGHSSDHSSDDSFNIYSADGFVEYINYPLDNIIPMEWVELGEARIRVLLFNTGILEVDSSCIFGGKANVFFRRRNLFIHGSRCWKNERPLSHILRNQWDRTMGCVVRKFPREDNGDFKRIRGVQMHLIANVAWVGQRPFPPNEPVTDPKELQYGNTEEESEDDSPHDEEDEDSPHDEEDEDSPHDEEDEDSPHDEDDDDSPHDDDDDDDDSLGSETSDDEYCSSYSSDGENSIEYIPSLRTNATNSSISAFGDGNDNQKASRTKIVYAGKIVSCSPSHAILMKADYCLKGSTRKQRTRVSAKQCFLLGVCLQDVRLSDVLYRSMKVIYELSSDHRTVSRVLIGRDDLGEDKQYLAIEKWCRSRLVKCTTTQALLKLSQWQGGDMAPVIDQCDIKQIVNAQI